MSTTLLFLIIAGYFMILMFISRLTSRHTGDTTFFDGNRQSPWFLVAFGMIGSGISAVSLVSIPGNVGNDNLYYFQFILGTVAVKEPGLVKAACKQWPGQVAVGIDAREGVVAVDGWTKQSTVRALDLALRFEDAGVAAIIYTDIDRDGAMGGVNIDATVTLAQHLTTPVIASGGVSSLDDLRELRPTEQYGIIGAIAGRALYDGRITVPDAIRVLKGE